MKLEDYAYTGRMQRIRKMSMAEMRIGVIQILMENNYRYAEIRVVNATVGEVDKYSKLDDFVLAECNESYEINLISVREMLIYNEEIEASETVFVVVIEEVE